MSEYIVELNPYPTFKEDGFSVRCDDWLIQREEIIRCRDCVYNAKDADGICYRFDHEHFNQPDGFCAWGKRKEAENGI